MATGWDNGLCQDYCRGLSLWFSSRLDARHTIRKHLMTQPNTQAPADERADDRKMLNAFAQAVAFGTFDDRIQTGYAILTALAASKEKQG